MISSLHALFTVFETTVLKWVHYQ